jgi:pimeloyl-ACP methyl ester carboxylesterase
MSASPENASSGSPTFVLIHGGGTTARFWDLITPRLPASLAVNVPGRADRPSDLNTLTVDEGADSIAQDIERAGADRLVFVAHSSGGLFVPGVIARLGKARVQAVILNAASVPPQGGNGLDCMRERHRNMTLAGLEMAKQAPLPFDKPFATRDSLRTSSGEELNESQIVFMIDRSVPEAINVYVQPVFWSESIGIPVTYIVNKRDRAVSPDLQRTMAARLPEPPTIVEIDTGHLPAVTAPGSLATLLVNANRLS